MDGEEPGEELEMTDLEGEDNGELDGNLEYYCPDWLCSPVEVVISN